MSLLEGNTLKRDSLDRRVWKVKVDGLFYVRFAYFQLDNLVEGKKEVFSKHFRA